MLVLTPGNIADITVAPALLAALPPRARLIADKGYDANSLRRRLDKSGTEAVIPSTLRATSLIRSIRPHTACATSSNACSAASKTFAASQPDTTSSPATSSPPWRSSPP